MGKMHNKPSCCFNVIIRCSYVIIQSTHVLTQQLCKCVKTLNGVVSLLSMMHKPPSIIHKGIGFISTVERTYIKWGFRGNLEHQTLHFLHFGEFVCINLRLFRINLGVNVFI